MGWCCPEGHEMKKPNLRWTSRALRPGEKPKTAAEKRSRRRWTAHCQACSLKAVL